jgi:hypothetical protein
VSECGRKILADRCSRPPSYSYSFHLVTNFTPRALFTTANSSSTRDYNFNIKYFTMKYSVGRFISYLQSLGKRICVACMEPKPMFRDFPKFSSCTPHRADICRSCISEYTATRLAAYRRKGWSICTCPRCDTRISAKELLRVLPHKQVKELKALVKEGAGVSGEPNWRWCVIPECDHGAVHTGKSEMITCGKCGVKACFEHKVPWHEGITGEEYGKTPRAQMAKANEDLIKKTTKRCPICSDRGEKNDGCDFVSCKCSDPHYRFSIQELLCSEQGWWSTILLHTYMLTQMIQIGYSCGKWWKWSAVVFDGDGQ